MINKSLPALYYFYIDPLLFTTKAINPTDRIKISYRRPVSLIRRTIKWNDRKRPRKKKQGCIEEKNNWKIVKMNNIPSNIS